MRLIDPIRSLYVRMIVLILIFLIPMYGVSYYLMGRAIGNVEEQLSHSIYVQVETTLANIEQDIQRALNQCYRLVNNSEILHLANIPSSLNAYERIEHMMLVFTLISAFLMALIVESIRRVIYRPMSRMMTTQEAMTHKAELKQLQSQINPHFLCAK